MFQTRKGKQNPPQDDSTRCLLESETFPRKLGSYYLLKRLAQGGMGEIFLATRLGPEGAEQPIVLKTIRPEYVHDTNFCARFMDEMRILSQLRHPGIVQVLETNISVTKSQAYVAMEFVEGRNLAEVMVQSKEMKFRMHWTEAVSIAASTLEALVHAHDRKDAAGHSLSIVHRDLSPHNLMISYEGNVKLIDFGTAKGNNRRCRTISGIVYAKPGYIAPEIAQGKVATKQTDLYAVGIILWELCSGERFLNGSPKEHLDLVSKNRLHPSQVSVKINAPTDLDGIIQKLTSFELTHRYENSRTALRDLLTLLDKAPVLPNGRKDPRERITQMMHVIFPEEPNREKKEFNTMLEKCKQMEMEELTPPFETPFEPSESESILHRYKLIRPLSQNIRHITYEAIQKSTERKCILKMSSHPNAKEWITQEAENLLHFQGESFLKVEDYGPINDKQWFLVTEFLKGQTLEEKLHTQVLSVQESVSIIIKSLWALEIIHAAGWVHGDISPSNLMILSDGNVKWIDFELSQQLSHHTNDLISNQELSHPPGTLEYMAPEQIESHSFDARSEVYSLGIFLYQVLTGHLPFPSENMVEFTSAKLKGHCPSPREAVPQRKIPRNMSEVVMKAMHRDPNQRYQSIEELREELEKVQVQINSPKSRGKKRIAGGLFVTASMAAAFFILAKSAHQIPNYESARKIVTTMSYAVQASLSGSPLFTSNIQYRLANQIPKPVLFAPAPVAPPIYDIIPVEDANTFADKGKNAQTNLASFSEKSKSRKKPKETRKSN